MKRSILKLTFIFILTLIFSFTVKVFASTNTFPRTEENLGIRDSIKVTDTVKRAALSTPKVDEKEKVYDFANLLTDEEEKKLYSSINQYIEKYDMDMAVVTIDKNNKASAMDYADDFYDYNNFGVGSTYNGLLFLIDMDTREMWISTTGEAIRVYSDARIDSILDSTYNHIKSQKYYLCANAFVSRASSYASLGVPSSNKNTYINENGEYIVNTTDYMDDENYGISFGTAFVIVSLLVSTTASLIFVIVSSNKHKTIKKATQAKQYLVNGSFNLTEKEDRFVTSHTTKHYNPPSSSRSGGSGGGSSTHFSSSGSSHGGGGRSF